MLFSYNWLQSFFDKKLPKPKKLVELLTIHAFEVEEIKKIGKDWVFDIDILSNRVSDCGGHLGIAREIGAIIKLKVKNEKLKVKVKSSKFKIKDFLDIEVKEPSLCPRYTARIITDVKVGQSPRWILERLKVCGLRPINNIVDATNYVMLEMGQPLHAFDFNEISGKKIVVRKAKKEEKIISLDGDKYDLDEDILVIADSKDPLAIAGIKGGKKAEIDKNTKTIVLEAANFEMKTIRKARQKLGLQTDASFRFEHCLDPNLTETAINRVADLIREIADGKIVEGIKDFYPKKVLPKKIKLNLGYVEKLLGVKIPDKEIKSILERLDFSIKDKRSENTSRSIEVEVPTRRLDISIPEDLIEEIARIYGYDKIKPLLPIATLIPPERNQDIFWQNFVKNILKEIGFSEVYNYSFISERDIGIYQLNQHKSAVIEIENPMSIEQKYLSPSLIPNLLKNVQKNQKQFEEIKIFETGKTYKLQLKTKNLKEKTMLAGVIAGKESKQGFYELKGAVDLLLNKLGISDVWYDEYKSTPEDSKIAIWQPGKCAEIKIGREEIGFLGEISQEILENLKIKGEVCPVRDYRGTDEAQGKQISNGVCVFDIDFEKLSKQCSEEHQYQPISLFPSAVRDLAILVPREIKVVDVLNKINSVGGALVRDVDLFDIYEGKELPENKKNFAFHIIYQADDRTLIAKEIDEIQNKIVKALEKEVAWEIRR